jgi:hypothetical protein
VGALRVDPGFAERGTRLQHGRVVVRGNIVDQRARGIGLLPGLGEFGLGQRHGVAGVADFLAGHRLLCQQRFASGQVLFGAAQFELARHDAGIELRGLGLLRTHLAHRLPQRRGRAVELGLCIGGVDGE